MKIVSKLLWLGVVGFCLTSCETLDDRISKNPDMFNSLSPRDQALVRQGQIRSGMPTNAVWLAWGAPEQKVAGEMRGHQTETWIYLAGTTAYGYGYGYGGYGPWGYGYGPWGYGGFGGFGVARFHGGHRFVFFGDPFYDPFYYSYIPPTIYYPYKTVTFSGGRVMSFQYFVNQ